jgi:hypothetical protein
MLEESLERARLKKRMRGKRRRIKSEKKERKKRRGA